MRNTKTQTSLLVGALAAGVALLLGCSSGGGATPPAAKSSSRIVTTTVDGLIKADIEIPGTLFIRDDHRIGSYDAFMVSRASISYRRGSRRLSQDLEQEFLATLEQSLIDAAVDAEIPILESPGNCVMQVGMALIDVDLESSRLANTLGSMILVMEFKDSTSGAPLLRFATNNELPREQGMNQRDQMRRGFDDMMDGMQVAGALRGAGLADDELRPGCRGTLAELGRRLSAGEAPR